jgi:IstB-like ATP binding protein
LFRGSRATAEREGLLRERIRWFCRSALLIVDEIDYLPVAHGGGNLFFQLVNARYEKGAMILTSNRGFAEWGEVFGDPVVATALLDRLLHMLSSSRSRGPATACASTPTSYPSTSAPSPDQLTIPGSRAATPWTTAKITTARSAGRLIDKLGNFTSAQMGKVQPTLTSRQGEIFHAWVSSSMTEPILSAPGEALTGRREIWSGQAEPARAARRYGPTARRPGCLGIAFIWLAYC